MRLPAILAVLACSASARADIDFAREVLPILAENCFHCHGPDDAARKAGLRLDTKEGAFRVKRDLAMIVPGKSGESELIRRVHVIDDDTMPPTDSNRKLTAKQKETLKKWVDEGAKWGKHWAYEPLPKNVKGSIDAFILERLKKEGLTPAAATTKEAWLRRVTFDLTGLPPSLKELDDFAKDASPEAYEKVVDRLLASPRYGERMASDWLDLARFADTLGYQHDRPSPMWPYRDWVIKSFNRNQRYDEFLTEQLAGDLLPKATKEQRLATAFNRLHMQNEEGGIVAEEFRVAYVVDRVTTMGTAFMGQTFECCRCHDHKFDPLTQKDFYSLFAAFQNIAESGQTSYFTNAMNTPTLLLSTPEQDAKIKELTAKVKEAETRLRTVRTLGDEAFKEWNNKPTIDSPDMVALYRFANFEGKTLENEKNAKAPGKSHEAPKRVKDSVEFDGESGFELPGVGHFSKSDPFSIVTEFSIEAAPPRLVVLHHSKAPIDAGSRGYELLIEDGHISFGLHHMWPGNSVKVRTVDKIPLKTWIELAITYDGSGRAAGIGIWLEGKEAKCEIVRDTLTKDILYGSEPNLALGYRFRDNGFKGGAMKTLAIFNRQITQVEVALFAGRIHELPKQLPLEDYFFSAVDKTSRERRDELRDARHELAKFIEPIPEAMVMDELPKPKPAFVLKRGSYDAPGEPVSMDTPKSLPPFPADLPRNRLGLAMWLTQPDHPLTGRVAVNRLWQQMFGRGLVETSDNFGTTGTPPTHPKLLDWLARDFIDHGWDVKRTLKAIALSDTYRRSSRATAEMRAKDPVNHLLVRAPVRRLSAEMLRDQALFTSGLLTEKLGGPSVYPYQPAGLWNDAMGKPPYPQSKGADLYRRSLYTHWKRTAPPPTLTTFDAADRSVCNARRQATSTPLQALVLLNDPQYVEAARVFAERVMLEGGEDKLKWAFRTIIGRVPTDAEVKVLERLFEEQKPDAKTAEKLLSIGDSKRNVKLDAIELAAYTQVTLALFNHDEAVNRR